MIDFRISNLKARVRLLYTFYLIAVLYLFVGVANRGRVLVVSFARDRYETRRSRAATGKGRRRETGGE